MKQVPFEYACVEYDVLYYNGECGYVTRLIADYSLRQAIFDYAINNTDEIKNRIGFDSDEVALLLYESLTELEYDW